MTGLNLFAMSKRDMERALSRSLQESLLVDKAAIMALGAISPPRWLSSPGIRAAKWLCNLVGASCHAAWATVWSPM